MKTPLHLVIARINRLSPADQIPTLKGLISHEKPYSIRRKELEDFLFKKTLRQLKRENRAA